MNLNEYDVIYIILFDLINATLITQFILNENYKNKIIIFTPKKLVSKVNEFKNLLNLQVVIPLIDESVNWDEYLQPYMTNFKNPVNYCNIINGVKFDKAIYGTETDFIDVINIVNSIHNEIQITNNSMGSDPHPEHFKTLKLYYKNELILINEGDVINFYKLKTNIPNLYKNDNIIKVNYCAGNTKIDITEEFKLKFNNEITFNNDNFSDRFYGEIKYLNIQTNNGDFNVIENSTFPNILKSKLYEILINSNIKEQKIYDFLKYSTNVDLYRNHIINCLVDFNNNKCLIFSIPYDGAGIYCYLNYYKWAIQCMLNNNFIIEICGQDGFSLYKDFTENNVFKNLYITDILGNNIINTYFSPNDNILNKIMFLKIKYNINYETCIGVVYRGTDKISECTLPNVNNYINKINELLTEDPELDILLQTDEQLIYDVLVNNFKNKIISFEEIPKSTNGMNVFHNKNITNKMDKIAYFDASIRIISNCKYIITNNITSVTSILIDYRNNIENVYKIE